MLSIKTLEESIDFHQQRLQQVKAEENIEREKEMIRLLNDRLKTERLIEIGKLEREIKLEKQRLAIARKEADFSLEESCSQKLASLYIERELLVEY